MLRKEMSLVKCAVITGAIVLGMVIMGCGSKSVVGPKDEVGQEVMMDDGMNAKPDNDEEGSWE